MPKITNTIKNLYKAASGETLFRIDAGNITIFEGSKNELSQQLDQFPGILDLEILENGLETGVEHLEVKETSTIHQVAVILLKVDYKVDFTRKPAKAS